MDNIGLIVQFGVAIALMTVVFTGLVFTLIDDCKNSKDRYLKVDK
ncbi:MAG: hypothetical protein U9O94_02955 [Nanoarchaeota archaeon]|nr:hypothetical protein [Nanoarchaeota archaeon]